MAHAAKFRDMLIDGCAPLRDALRQLCANSKRALFISEDGVLKASLSDGDVRRFLLAGGDLDAPVSQVAFQAPRFLFSSERERAAAFLAEHNLTAVPIVDDDRRILDVVLAHEVVNIDDVEVRELTKNDLSMVIEFFDQMAGDTRAMFNRGDVNRLRAIEHLNRKEEDDQIHFAAVVRNHDGSETMVGYAFLWELERKLPWLGIAVREGWKGHHLGRILLQYLEDWVRPRGYGGLMLTSVPANIRAHSLYTRMGFEYFGVYPDSEFLYLKRFCC